MSFDKHPSDNLILINGKGIRYFDVDDRGYISEPYFEKSSGKEVITYIMPVKKQFDSILITVDFIISDLCKNLGEMQITSNSEVFLMSSISDKILYNSSRGFSSSELNGIKNLQSRSFRKIGFKNNRYYIMIRKTRFGHNTFELLKKFYS